MPAYRLTTIDNPFDPINDFENWYFFDESKGYCTCGLLARLAKTSDALTDEENERIIQEAIDDIIRLDFMHRYKVVQVNTD